MSGRTKWEDFTGEPTAEGTDDLLMTAHRGIAGPRIKSGDTKWPTPRTGHHGTGTLGVTGLALRTRRLEKGARASFRRLDRRARQPLAEAVRGGGARASFRRLDRRAWPAVGGFFAISPRFFGFPLTRVPKRF